MLPDHKTKIVCTIGPASETVEVLEGLIRAGMDVARLNFSHGDFESHAGVMGNVLEASRAAGRHVLLMADLPGPKFRVGEVPEGPVGLEPGDDFTLTTEVVEGDRREVSVDFGELPEVVSPGDTLFLNDGVIQLEVREIEPPRVRCRVVVGGEISSRKGLNLPGIDLGRSAFTTRDRECLEFALSRGVQAVSQSFVTRAEDVEDLRSAAAALGHDPFVIAKIERAGAVARIDEILAAADGIMVARGDLGVETPIEEIAVTQKRLVDRANRRGKPVITATHMLESMVDNRRPTRAEVTDVANAILDGTDAVMLSAESAVGRHPVAAVRMLARIAAATEPHRPGWRLREALEIHGRDGKASAVDLIALGIHHTSERSRPVVVFVPTRSGHTARSVARFRLPTWIVAFSHDENACRTLQLSYGVHAEHVVGEGTDWDAHARAWLHDRGVEDGMALLARGPSRASPDTNHRLEILELSRRSSAGPSPGRPAGGS